MVYHSRKMMMASAVLQVVLVGGAHAKSDALRCEAKRLRCESSFYECLAVCDRRMDAQPDPAEQAVQTRHSQCEGSCEDRHVRKAIRVENTPACKEVTPNPRECEARYLAADSSYMICQSRCEGRSNAVDCNSACATRYQTVLDELNAAPVCQDGRVAPSS
jgi:hypothetical protein